MSKEIKGPFEFDEEPPKHLMGWRPDLAPVALKACQPHFSHYDCEDNQRPPAPTPIWELTKRINNGRHLPTFRQETGDCVGAGLAQAGARLQVAEIATLYQEELLKLWNTAFIYGISRVQIGGGRIPGPGSTGAWGAAAVKQYGVLFDSDVGVPPYSGHLSDRWGDRPGPPEEFQAIAADNLVRTIAPLVSIEDLRDALCNYHPITVASMQGFRMKPIERDGFHVFVPEGTWTHQMALIAWMDEPFPAAYRLNSWGPNAHGTPLNEEPPGGAWCTADVLEHELSNPQHEFFTYSKFDGFPSAADRGILSIFGDDAETEFHKQEQRDASHRPAA